MPKFRSNVEFDLKK